MGTIIVVFGDKFLPLGDKTKASNLTPFGTFFTKIHCCHI
jgi:Na+/H+ antiporter NhaC